MTAFNFKWKYENIAAVVCVPQTTHNLVISLSCPVVEDGKEIYKDLQCTCSSIVFCLVAFSRSLHEKPKRMHVRFSMIQLDDFSYLFYIGHLDTFYG